jgi:polyhydroxyalkanoate synthesis regulator phasin
MKKGKKKALIITVIVVVVFAVSGVVAFAATNISDIEKLYLAFRSAQAESAVDKGDMTAEDAQEYLSNLTDRVEEDETDAVPPLRGGENGKRPMMGPDALEMYAEVSGTSVDDIKADCEAAETSVFALADEAGLLDELKAAMIEDAQARIDEMLADGKIDAEKAEEMKEDATEAINAITAETRPPIQNGPGQRPGGMGRQQTPEHD